MNTEREKYKRLLERAQTSEKPVVLVNACTHGHETVGVRVAEELRGLTLKKGTLLFNVANERAKERGTAFIESDLNRSFPGKPNGTYEQRLAHLIDEVVRECDIVIDIHATETTDPGSESAIIVTKLDEKTKAITDVLNPPRVLVMDYTKSNALISHVKIGIGFEYGRNGHPQTLKMIVRDTKKLLAFLGMRDRQTQKASMVKTRYYRVSDVFPKSESVSIRADIQNYVPIAKGDPIGTKDGKPLLASCDFIPILFGNNRYKDIFGFLGREL